MNLTEVLLLNFCCVALLYLRLIVSKSLSHFDLTIHYFTY